ncbi:hypothetical protein V5799_016636 [Amblyomma americanum]|uniref:Secreted protein n=1 Tax=Amblyomma americanum TaxID=6943 RepID=A0AAQ4F5M6_AMBAM
MKHTLLCVCVLATLVAASMCKPSSWREKLPNPYNIRCPRLCLPGQRRMDPCTQGCRCGFVPGTDRNGRLFCTQSVLFKNFRGRPPTLA